MSQRGHLIEGETPALSDPLQAHALRGSLDGTRSYFAGPPEMVMPNLN
jgi:hypothetical protein